MPFRSGFVSIIGRPNAGKSTLLNKLVGEKLAIVTPKPQTTRDRILGIVNAPARIGRPAGQIVFIDTPGVHKPDSSLNKKMMREVHEALEGRDAILLIVDATQKFGPGDRFTLDLAKKAGGPVLLLLNKIDRLEKARLLPMIAEYSKLHDFREIIPISALTGDGLELLLDRVMAALPEGPRYFPKDQITDQPERFLAAEIVREKVLLETAQEVPYAATVVVERWEESPRLTSIAAVIYCERDGQKKIIIGRGGEMLKRIGTAARYEIERILGTKVFLELFVKVRPGWRESREFVEELDWRKQLEGLTDKPEE
ncbi:MAG TPA: GTPase Era [Terriglobales bacterium]|nr:GTPase Era [Terriglobales bacterium]